MATTPALILDLETGLHREVKPGDQLTDGDGNVITGVVSAGFSVKDDGVDVGTFDILNFAGVTIVDEGAGQVKIVVSAVTDHAALTGLLVDDHTQYANLNGRSGGQDLAGSTIATEGLTLRANTAALDGTVDIPTTTASTSSVTGALVVAGGVGIGDDLFVAGDVDIGGKLTVVGLIDPTGLQLETQASNPGNVNTLWIRTSDGALMQGGTVGATTDHGGLLGLGDDDHTQYPLLVGRAGGQDLAGSSLTGEGLTLRANAAALNGTVAITTTTASSNSATGALTVAGGAGVAGALNVGGAVDIADTTAAASPSTGALVVDGGVGIAGDLFVGGSIDLPETLIVTEAASVPGGVPSAGDGKLWVRNDVPNVLVFTDDSGVDTVFGAGGVSSVFTRSGAVVAAAGDYTATQVTFAANGDIVAVTVQAAIVEVRDDTDTKLSGKASTAHTHTLVDVTDSGALAALNTVGSTEIDTSAVTLAKMADITTDSFLGRDTAATGAVEVLTATQVRTIINVADGAVAEGATGDTHAAIVTGNPHALDAVDVGAAPTAHTHVFADLPDIATDSFLGRTTAATGVIEVLTGTQATVLLDDFTSGLSGLAPASGGGTTNFLRADGTWASPGVGGDSLPVPDTTSIVEGSVDATKEVRFEVDGLTTGMIRIITMPDQDITLDDNTDSRPPSGSASGDLTGTYPGPTIATSAVTLAKMADLAADTIIGRANGGGTGVPQALTAAQVRTIINVDDGATAYVHPNHTGDVTSVADGAQTIAASAVTLAKMADIATASFLGRVTAATGIVEVLTGTQATTLLDDFTSGLSGLAPSSGGGTANYLRADGTWAVPPGTGGSLPATDDTIIVQDNVDGTKQMRFEASGIPTSTTIVLTLPAASVTLDGTTDSRTPSGSASGDLTGTYPGPTIAASAVTLAKMANVATATLLGRVTAATGVVEALTGTQATTLLDDFTSGLSGLAPSSGGGTANYLRADGTWAVPPGTGGSLPATDDTIIVQDNVDGTKQMRFEASGIPTSTTIVLTLPAASVTLDGTTDARPPSGSASGDLTGTYPGPTIATSAVTLAKMANIATSSFLGRVTAATGIVEVLTGTQATTLLDTFTSGLDGLAPASGGGTTNFLRADGTWASPGVGGDSLPVPDTTSIVEGSVDATKEVRFEVGGLTTGTIRTITMPDANITLDDNGDSRPPSGSASGDLTGTYPGPTIATSAVTLAKMANVATASILGRVTAATGVVEALTGTQATTLLDDFTSGLSGLAPASGGGTTNFLRADGTWAAPAGGGGFPLLAPNGLVSAPSYSFTNSTGTGLYWDGTSQMKIAVGGTDIIGFDSIGFVDMTAANPRIAGIDDSTGTAIVTASGSVRTFHYASGSTAIDLEANTVTDASAVVAVNWGTRRLFGPSGNIVLDWSLGDLNNLSGLPSVDYNTHTLYDTSGFSSVGYSSRALLDSSGNSVVDWSVLALNAGATSSLDWNSRYLYDSSSVLSVEWGSRYLYDSGGTLAVDWGNRDLYDSGGSTRVDWDNSDGFYITGSAGLAMDSIFAPGAPSSAGGGILYFDSSSGDLMVHFAAGSAVVVASYA